MAENGEQGRAEEEEVAEISGGSVWSASTTRMLISYYKENPILWNKRLKENGNKAKTKKAMAPLIARFEKVNPRRSAQDLKAKRHSLSSSVLRYLTKQEEEDIEIKWPFWEDMNFLRASFQNSNDDNLVWTADEIGNTFSSSYWMHVRYTCHFNTTNAHDSILWEQMQLQPCSEQQTGTPTIVRSFELQIFLVYFLFT